jgi:D-tagatose-1,6-bisphosphate aldolase subunit GatZ/KbaZ
MPQFVLEAHSTDYQQTAALSALVDDGFAILKVGPWLTFALREVLYGLDCVAEVLVPGAPEDRLPAAMERLMLGEPGNWQKYYHGAAKDLKFQRHFSYSDRIRYYWPHRDAQAALKRLDGQRIPETLVSQYLAALYPAVAAGRVEARPRNLQIAAVRTVLAAYWQACGGR